MMKKFFPFFSILFGTVFVFQVQATGYHDISENSPLKPMVEYFEQKNILEGKGFFRSEDTVPAIFFWEVLFRDGGFDPKSATFSTPLPPNVSDKDPKAQFLREGIRRNFIKKDENFDALRPISKTEAVKWMPEVKGIAKNRKSSKKFQNLVSGVSPLASYAGYLESMYASKFLTKADISPFRADDPLTRREFITWLYQWHQNGENRISSFELPEMPNTEVPAKALPYQKRVTEENQIKLKNGLKNIQVEWLKQEAIEKTQKAINLDLQVLQAVFDQILKKYRFRDEVDEKKQSSLINAGTENLVKTLGDKYSNYIGPDESEEFLESLEGEFEGIGAYVEMIDGAFTITSPIKGSPAEVAGLLPMDVVIKVDDTDISGLSISEIIKKVRGKSGTVVKLTIKRENVGQLVIYVTRGKITVPALTLEFKNGIAVVGLHQFSRNTGSELEKMISEEVLPKKPRGIIFDLRNNPGGFLTSAVEVGQIFLKKGETIFSTDYKDDSRIYTSEKNGLLAGHENMIFLQNKGSASASEILTAMVKDHGIGKIIGTASTGKGTVQEVVSFANGGTLKLTVAKWLSPKKNWIHEKGVLPDVEVTDPTPEEKQNKVDRQMETALQAILH